MSDTQSDLMEKLKRQSPENGFERFAKNFRNMGVVTYYGRGSSDGSLIVRTTEQGMNLSPVRSKGHDFDVVDVEFKHGEIRFFLTYNG